MNLEKLYAAYNNLSDAKEKVAEYDKDYIDAINATKEGEKEKKLAAQIISKFFKHFPDLQEQALNALFDLCEDDESSIRILAIRTFPAICKDCSKYIAKVADILGQLLQLEEQEYNIVCSVLLHILKQDHVTVVKSIFKIVNNKETEPALREKCLKLFTTKLKLIDRTLYVNEVEALIINELKVTIQDSTAEEFIYLMDYITSANCVQRNGSLQQEFVEIICDQMEIDGKFEPIDDKSNPTDRLVVCVKYILSMLSAKMDSAKFVVYYCDQVLPEWNNIARLESGSHYQFIIAQQLAELSQYCGPLQTPVKCVEQIFDILKMYMPYPPEEATTTMPFLNFSLVEALLFAFHRLARQCPEFLTDNQNVLKDFRSRLLYFSRGVQGSLKVLNYSDREKIFSAEEKRIRDISPKLLTNLNTLIKDLFYQPPIYKCSVTLSFKAEEKKNVLKTTSPDTGPTGTKRHVPIIYESNGSTHNKQLKPNRSTNEKRLYTPPSGKFSHNFYNNDRNPRFRGGRIGPSRGSRGRGRGNFRN